jgi:hypothetical protein
MIRIFCSTGYGWTSDINNTLIPYSHGSITWAHEEIIQNRLRDFWQKIPIIAHLENIDHTGEWLLNIIQQILAVYKKIRFFTKHTCYRKVQFIIYVKNQIVRDTSSREEGCIFYLWPTNFARVFRSGIYKAKGKKVSASHSCWPIIMTQRLTTWFNIFP